MMKKKLLFVVFSLLLAAIMPWNRPSAVWAEILTSQETVQDDTADGNVLLQEVPENTAEGSSSLKDAGTEEMQVTTEQGTASKKGAPAAPKYRSGTHSYNSITVQWYKVSKAAKYRVYYSTKLTSGWKYKTVSKSTTKVTFTGLTPGKAYYFRVRAVDSYGRLSGYGWTLKGKPLMKTPSNFRITGTNSRIRGVTLKWNTVAGATRYRLQYSTNGRTYYNVALEYGNWDTVYNLTRKVYYYFRIRAENSYTSSSYRYLSYKIRFNASASDTVSNVNITVSGQTAALSWDQIFGAKSYEIYRSTSSRSGFKKIGTGKSTSYKDSGLTYGKTYYYKVRAVLDEKEYSDYSSVAKAVIPAAEVTGLKISVSGQTAKLSWNKISGVKSYEIYRSTSALSGFKKVGTGESASFKSSGLSYGKTYYFKVRAVLGSKKYSDYSSVVKAEIPVGNISGVKVTVNEGNASLTWNALKGAASYEVYRSTSAASGFKKVGTSKGTSFEASGLKSGKTYYFKVRALYSENIYSGASKAVAAVIPAAQEVKANASAATETQAAEPTATEAPAAEATQTANNVHEECSADGSTCTITEKVCSETECTVTTKICVIVGDQKACAEPVVTVMPTETETPAATEEAPAEPAATEEAPAEPAATEEAPAEPAATEEAPAEPAAAEEAPAEPAATEEAPAEPAATEEAPAEEPAATEEAPAEPAAAEETPAEEPAATEEAPAEPAAAEEAPAEPAAAEETPAEEPAATEETPAEPAAAEEAPAEDLTILEINVADLTDNTITFKAQESYTITADKLQVLPEAADWAALSFKLDDESIAALKSTDIETIKAEGLTINGLVQGTTTLRIQAGNVEKAVTLVINMSAADEEAAAQAAAEAEAAAQAAAEAEAAAQAAAEAEAAAQAAAEAEAAAQAAAEAEAAAQAAAETEAAEAE